MVAQLLRLRRSSSVTAGSVRPDGRELRPMRRDTKTLESREFDLVVIGGGIFGVCAAWDAALRGLSVALLEKGDFSHATSASHHKVVHGGIRYLQHGDIPRVRESSRERSALLRIAPHLVHPLPIVIPTYGHGAKGKGILRCGFFVYDLLTLDRNRGIRDPSRHIPAGRFLSRNDVLRLFPGIQPYGLTGGAVFCDGQVYNPPRLALAFVRAAVGAGAVAANYIEVTKLLRDERRIVGVEAVDRLAGDRLLIRGRLVLNAAGPWAATLLADQLGIDPSQLNPSFSRDVSLVVSRSLGAPYGLACSTVTKDAEAVIDRGGRHLFLMPWRDCTLVGVWHRVHNGSPDSFAVSDQELQGFIDDTNRAYPNLRLTVRDILAVNTGLILFGDGDQSDTEHRFGRRSVLTDHAATHGIEGLITLIGVRATTARGMAERAIDLVFRKLGRRRELCRTAKTPIHGGDFASFGDLLREARERAPATVEPDNLEALVHHHGSEYTRVLEYIDEDPSLAHRVGAAGVLRAEVLHAVREEMAQTLSDVVLRRTDLANLVVPSNRTLGICADVVAAEAGWDRERKDLEIADTRSYLAHRGAIRSFDTLPPATRLAAV